MMSKKNVLRHAMAYGLLVSVGGVPLPAYAKSETFFSAWTVESPQISSDVLVLNKGDFVQRTRLLPIGLVELTTDLPARDDGIIALSAGAQLFELTGGHAYRPRPASAAVFCSVKTFPIMRTGLLGKKEFQLRHCLVDLERDGQFDGVVIIPSCLPDFPIAIPKIPDDLPRIDGPKYRRIPNTEVRDGPIVGIVYSGIAPLDGDPRFFQSFGSGNPVPLFGEKHSRAGEALGQRISFGGAFTILGVEGKTVRVRNDRAMPVQPFVLVGGTDCRG